MSSNEMALVRSKLRELSSTVQERRGEMTSVSSCGITEVINEANEMHGLTSKDTRASALDANLISTMASLGAEQAGNLEKINPDSWVMALGAAYGVGRASGPSGAPRVSRINWKRLGEEVREAGIFFAVPGVTFIMADYEPVEKKARERKQKDRTPSEPLQTVSSTSVDGIKEGNEDKAQTSRLKVLRETVDRETKKAPRGINLFKLLLHPTSFSQTVENFFDFAFVIKDGRASVKTVSESGAQCPFVRQAQPPDTEAYESGVFRQQNLIALDYKTYRKLVSKWLPDPAEALLPDRSDPSSESFAAPAAKKARRAE